MSTMRVERLAHRIDRRLVGPLLIAPAPPARRRDRRGFGDAGDLDGEHAVEHDGLSPDRILQPLDADHARLGRRHGRRCSIRCKASRIDNSSVSWVMSMKERDRAACLGAGARCTMLSIEIFSSARMRGDGRDRARPVIELERDIIAAVMRAFGGARRYLRSSFAGTPKDRPQIAARDVDDIGKTADAVGCAPAPRPSSIRSPAKSPLHHDRIEDAVGIGNRRSLGHQRRMHALLDAFLHVATATPSSLIL